MRRSGCSGCKRDGGEDDEVAVVVEYDVDAAVRVVSVGVVCGMDGD